MIVNTPSGPAARADGYEIRAAAVAMDRPIITTVQELGAAVHGIEALGQGALGVRSLQDWHAAAAGEERR
jgi:carbamoyl-phosphate synthase large subunit